MSEFCELNELQEFADWRGKGEDYFSMTRRGLADKGERRQYSNQLT